MRRPDLISDCAQCYALCCSASSFQRSEDFAFDKPAGEPCRHVTSAFRCAIHAELSARGFPGCAAYECYGAGPRLTRALASGSCREEQRIEAFLALRVVHEWLWLLTEATKLCPPSQADLCWQLEHATAALDGVAAQPPRTLIELDLTPHRDRVQGLLRSVGQALGGRRRTRKSLDVL